VTAWIGKPAAGHVTTNGSPATAEIGGILRIIGNPEGKNNNKWNLAAETRENLYRMSDNNMGTLRECILQAIWVKKKILWTAIVHFITVKGLNASVLNHWFKNQISFELLYYQLKGLQLMLSVLVSEILKRN
jgi:hypothetical protein